ncbi:Uncharacterized protein APZ42_008972, partial [Daphnia magna]
VEILAIIHAKTIHVYNAQLSSFTHNKTLNPSRYNKQCILHRGHGEWQRVEPNIMIENYCEKIDEAFFEYQPIQTHYFHKFLDLLKKHGAKQQVIDSLKTLDPENGDTPDKL